MKNFFLQSTFLIVIILALAGSFLGGVVAGFNSQQEGAVVGSLINGENGKPAGLDFSPFWRAWRLIEEKHINPQNGGKVVADEEKLWGAIRGLVVSLGDPYSDFLPPTQKTIFEEDISGAFGGVGIEVGIQENTLRVIAPLPASPAKKAGIIAGDKIIEVGGVSAAELGITEAIRLIRGKIGTEVVLTILRDEDEIHRFKLIRAKIEVPTLQSEILPGNIFLVRLYNFGATAPTLFRQSLRDMLEIKSRKMILDLRDNPGGFLTAAVDIGSWFLPAGAPIVIEERGVGSVNDEAENIYRSRGYNVFGKDLKLVVLINGGSASASEILAGALQEYGLATLVGEKTFGKGSVQELVPLTDDTALKLTIARWLTPKKRVSLSKEGLTPDIVLPNTGELEQVPERDPQLKKAIELLYE